MTMTKRELAVRGIIQLLDEAGLSVDEKIKALGEVRAKLVRPFRVVMPFSGPNNKPGKRKKDGEDE